VIKVVQNYQSLFTALQLDNDTHAVPVAFIADVTDSFNALVIDEFRNFFDQTRLVHLIGNLGHNDDIAILALTLDRSAGSHGDLAAACLIGLPYSATTMDDPGRGEIRARNPLIDFLKLRVRLVDKMNDGL